MGARSTRGPIGATTTHVPTALCGAHARRGELRLSGTAAVSRHARNASTAAPAISTAGIVGNRERLAFMKSPENASLYLGRRKSRTELRPPAKLGRSAVSEQPPPFA